MRNVSAKKKLGEEFDCYIHTVLFFSGIISVSRALSKSKWKKNLLSLESEIMMWMCRYFDCLHTVVTQKPLLRVLFLFECDINWKRKKFSSFPPPLSHSVPDGLPRVKLPTQNFSPSFFAILQTHILVIFLFFYSLAIFFNNNFFSV